VIRQIRILFKDGPFVILSLDEAMKPTYGGCLETPLSIFHKYIRLLFITTFWVVSMPNGMMTKEEIKSLLLHTLDEKRDVNSFIGKESVEFKLACIRAIVLHAVLNGHREERKKVLPVNDTLQDTKGEDADVWVRAKFFILTFLRLLRVIEWVCQDIP
jgi:hypothetical protein